jgi:hypothetical protein
MNSQLPSTMPVPTPYGVDLVTWEYKSLILDGKKMEDPKTMEPLNQLGAEGWELVNAMPANAVVKAVLYTFKRPRRR